LPTVTAAPLPTVTLGISPTSGVTPAVFPLLDYSSASYLDDRSTPSTLVLSYANAINRNEYLRAYAYWINPSTYLGTLEAFTSSMTNVSSVQTSLGPISSEGAAGSIYYTVPVLFKYTKKDSSIDRYAACYLLRFPQPGNYGSPPITPLHFDRLTSLLLTGFVSDADGLASACSGADFAGGAANSGAPGGESITDLSSGNYIDNRSGAVEVISSLINAINHKEYVRAYSYWENPSVHPGNYDIYAAGFNDTQAITATFGAVISDAGAGQFHYQIPVAEVVQTTGGTTQTFVGCYTLHISNPGIQGALPFNPLGITTGQFTTVANGTNTTPLLVTACN
jgi:hypothetical protein